MGILIGGLYTTDRAEGEIGDKKKNVGGKYVLIENVPVGVCRKCGTRYYMAENSLIPAERIEKAIYVLRGQQIMLDSDLAKLYGVTITRLNEQVKRNLDRFPADFMFRLTQQGWDALISQLATSKRGRGGRRKLPYAFTEHGAVMATNVLNSPVAPCARASWWCVLLYGCGRCSFRMKTLLANSRHWKRSLRSTMSNSELPLMPFANSWSLRP
jgi:YgiT-type zinc finger domain-containing protein